MSRSEKLARLQQEAAIEQQVFRRLLTHLDNNKDVQNIDLMIAADFCRNCLSKWYLEAAQDYGKDIDLNAARERIYGMPYAKWKEHHQPDATPEQLTAFEARAKA